MLIYKTSNEEIFTFMKAKKIIVPALAAMLGVSGATVATVQQISVYAEDGQYTGETISVTGFVSSVKVGEEWTVPQATAGATYTLTNSVGADVTKQYAVDGQPGHYIFGKSGTYVLKYTLTKNGVTTTTEPMYINVESAEYTVTTLSNTQHVLPGTVAPNTKLTFAVPTTTYDGEEQQYYTVSEGSVSHNAIDGRDVVISVYDQTNSPVYTSKGREGEAKVDSTGHVYFEYTPTTAGKYYVYYDIVDADIVQDRVSTNFVVKEGYDSSKIDLAMPEASKLSNTSIVLGKETTLPTAKVKDRNTGNYVDAYVEITITHYNTDGTKDVDVVTDYKYTFTKTGDYTISYKASIPVFGITTSTAKSYNVLNVTDSTHPEVYIVNNYQVDNNGLVTSVDGSSDLTATDFEDQDVLLKALGDATYKIPSTVVLGSDGATVTIPAMFATDNLSAYNKIKLTRSIYNGSSLKQIGEDKSAGEPIEYTFTEAGDYAIWFKAVDEANSAADQGTTKKITIKVVEESDIDDNTAKPVINTEVTNSSTSVTDKYVFAVPTATASYDDLVEVKTEYKFDEGEFTTLTETNKEGKYEIPLQVGKSKLIIQITATADDLGAGPRTNTITRTITLPKELQQGSNLDFDTTTVTNYLTELKSANADLLVQGQENLFEKGNIYLPSMKVSNNGTNEIAMSVIVRDKDDNQKDVYNSYVVTEGNAKTIQGGFFSANAKGTYTVTYIAKETGVKNIDGVNRQVSNIVTKTFIVNINGITTNQIVLSSWDSISTIALYEHFDVPTAELYVDGEKVEVNDGGNYKTTWRMYQGPAHFESLEAYKEHMGDDSLDETDLQNAYKAWKETHPMNTPVDISEEGFTPIVEGTYWIEYVAYNGSEEIARLQKTVVAEDMREYEIVFDNSKEYFKDYESYDFDSAEPIAVPTVSVKDNNGSAVVNCTVEVTCVNRKGKEVSADVFYYDDVAGDYKLVPTTNDVYKVTYKVRDENGKPVVTGTWEVTVGDVVAPQLSYDDEQIESVIKSSITIGEKFTLDTEALKDYVDEDKSSWENITITVTMQDASGNNVPNTYNNEDGELHPTFEATLKSTGTYTLKITLQDELKNTSIPYNFTITVNGDEAGSNNVGTVVGTVLIVLSLILLGGVIAYFVVTSRKGGKKSKKTNKK